MGNHKILNGVKVPLTEAEELELIQVREQFLSEAPQRAKEERNNLLSTNVDPVVSNALRWNDMSEAKRTEWTDYRQALLDIETLEGYPDAIVWPTKPE